jgi:hypothetical protein
MISGVDTTKLINNNSSADNSNLFPVLAQKADKSTTAKIAQGLIDSTGGNNNNQAAQNFQSYATTVGSMGTSDNQVAMLGVIANAQNYRSENATGPQIGISLAANILSNMSGTAAGQGFSVLPKNGSGVTGQEVLNFTFSNQGSAYQAGMINAATGSHNSSFEIGVFDAATRYFNNPSEWAGPNGPPYSPAALANLLLSDPTAIIANASPSTQSFIVKNLQPGGWFADIKDKLFSEIEQSAPQGTPADLASTDFGKTVSVLMSDVYNQYGALAASETLKSLTQSGGPHAADLAIKASSGIIDKITADMANMATLATAQSVEVYEGGGAPSDQKSELIKQFNAIYANLSASAAAADAGTTTVQLSPDGLDAARLIGDSIAMNAPNDPTAVALYGQAAETTIGSGQGAAVTFAAAKAAQRSGLNSTLAGALVDGAGKGLFALADKVKKDMANFAQKAAPLIALQERWGWVMTSGGFNKATKGYINDHPDLYAAGLTVSDDGNAIVEANQAMGSFGSSLTSIQNSEALTTAQRRLDSAPESYVAFTLSSLLSPPSNRPYARPPGNPLAGAQSGFAGLGFVANSKSWLGTTAYGLATVANGVATLRDLMNGDYGQGAVDALRTTGSGLTAVGGIAALQGAEWASAVTGWGTVVTVGAFVAGYVKSLITERKDTAKFLEDGFGLKPDLAETLASLTPVEGHSMATPLAIYAMYKGTTVGQILKDLNGAPSDQAISFLQEVSRLVMPKRDLTPLQAQREQVANYYAGNYDLAELNQLAHTAFGADYQWSVFSGPNTVPTGVDYTNPPSWIASSTNNTDPINVIISGNSTVPIDKIISGLRAAGYEEVGNGVGTSVENFDSGDGSVGQDYSLRQGGYASEFSSGNRVNHVRVWQQSETGALFISASFEKFVGSETLADGTTVSPWHKVVDYNNARDAFVNAVIDAAKANGWTVKESLVVGPTGYGTPDNVSYYGPIDVLTITPNTGQNPF